MPSTNYIINYITYLCDNIHKIDMPIIFFQIFITIEINIKLILVILIFKLKLNLKYKT